MEIVVKDLKVNYQTYGDKNNKPIVLLHGWGQSLETFTYLAKTLCEKNYVITVDFPGFGNSEEPTSAWGVKQYRNCILEMFDKLNISNPTILGHSFGGRIAISIASYNKNIEKLILVNSAGIKPKRRLNYYIKVYWFKLAKNILKLLRMKKTIEKLRNNVGSADYRNASPIMKKILIKIVNTDQKSELHKIKADTLIIWGKDDSATPLAMGKVLDKHITNSGLVVMEKCGHFSYLEKPLNFSKIVNHYIDN